MFKFLNVKKKSKLSVSDLEKAYKPHMFRLKLESGKEEEEALHAFSME